MAELMLEALPAVITLTSTGADLAGAALRALTLDSARTQVGAAARVAMLSTLLVLEGIRDWLATLDDAQLPRWLGALRHPTIGPVMAAIHAEPGGDWTATTLAARASMSRSSFYEAFRALVGTTPAKYVQRVRFGFATSMLRSSRRSVAEVAYACGYESESAFSRAYRRHTVQTPSAVRQGVAEG